MNEDALSEYEVALAKTPAPPPGRNPIEELLERLEDLGVKCPNQQSRQAAYDMLEVFGDREGDSKASQFVSWVLGRLPGGRRGLELREALLRAAGVESGTNLAAEARGAGITKQTLSTKVKRLAKRFGKTADRTPLYRSI